MSKPDIAILIVVLAGVGSLLVAILHVTDQINEEIEDTGPFNWISPGTQISGISAGSVLILCILLVAAMFLTKGIVWG